jgi:hypothetical protein
MTLSATRGELMSAFLFSSMEQEHSVKARFLNAVDSGGSMLPSVAPIP